jgi:GNAT superfamily N-acetyltransferase
MKSKITVRDFIPSDTDKLLKYREETARMSFPGKKLDKEHARKAILRHMQKWPGTVRLACQDSKPVGFIMFQPKRGSLGSYGYINAIFVEKAHRDKGVGALLLKSAEDWLHKKGIKRINAAITATNKHSLDFFREHGYMNKRTVVEKRI